MPDKLWQNSQDKFRTRSTALCKNTVLFTFDITEAEFACCIRFGDSFMRKIKGTKTEENLLKAFRSEAETAMRYEYFAMRANIEGSNDISMLFASSAAGERAHAHGHLEYLGVDTVTGNPINRTRSNLQSAIDGGSSDFQDMYLQMADIAREEGFEEIAVWFETLSRAARSHANQFQKALDSLLD